MNNTLHNIKIRSLLILSISLFGIQQVKSQKDIVSFLNAGVEDANKLVEAYISPFGNAFGASLNSGWFNTAESHKIAGFDITFSLNGIYAPKDVRTFDFSKLNTTNLQLLNSTDDPISPSIFGDQKPGPDVAVVISNPMFGITPGSSQDTMLTSFKLPQGAGFNFIGLPNLHSGVYLLNINDKGTIETIKVMVK